MSANTETTGADFEHQALCPVERGGSCNCVPIAAPAAHVERRKGQRWRRQWRDMTEEVTLLGRSEWTREPGWNVGPGDALHDACWTDPSLGNTMTLLADATPEPAKCEPWCGNDLPPEGRPGWGFLLDDDANVAERFKLGRAGFTKRDRAIGWCTDECRESYISKTGFREMKSPSVQEAYPATPCVKCGRAHTGGCGYGAQEAPKAAPVCDIARDTHAGPVLMRWIRAGKGAKPSLTPACEQCHVLSERAGRFGGVFPASILHDKDVPTRLPRPQLAADWVEDCLPEIGR